MVGGLIFYLLKIGVGEGDLPRQEPFFFVVFFLPASCSGQQGTANLQTTTYKKLHSIVWPARTAKTVAKRVKNDWFKSALKKKDLK